MIDNVSGAFSDPNMISTECKPNKRSMNKFYMSIVTNIGEYSTVMLAFGSNDFSFTNLFFQVII